MSKEKLQTEIKKALKNKDELRLNVFRQLLSAYTNQVMAQGKKPNEDLNEMEEISIYKKQAKQRKEAILAFNEGNRPELAEKEEAELKIIEELLPESLNEAEILEIIIEKKKELNIENDSQLGLLIGSVMKVTQGQADGALVKKLAENLLKK